MTIDWQAFAHPGPVDPGPVGDETARRAAAMMQGHSRRDLFVYLAASYDRWDFVHFQYRGIGRVGDVWDNRRKVVA